MKKSDTIEKNVQSLFELGQQAFSEIVMFMDTGDTFMKARLKDHDFSTKVFQINAKNINEEMIDSTDKFKDCFEKVDRPICDEEGRICEKIKFGESGFFYLDIQDGQCLKNIDTHSMNSFFINYNKELNQYCFFKFSKNSWVKCAGKDSPLFSNEFKKILSKKDHCLMLTVSVTAL